MSFEHRSTDRMAGGLLRGSPRVVYRLDVSDPDGRDIGFLVDVSLGGMRVRCHGGITVSKLTRLDVAFPRWLGLGESLKLSGRFAWCKPHGTDQIEGGFAFDSLSQEATKGLEALIDQLVAAAIEDVSV